jgi:hypothetical protein
LLQTAFIDDTAWVSKQNEKKRIGVREEQTVDEN